MIDLTKRKISPSLMLVTHNALAAVNAVNIFGKQALAIMPILEEKYPFLNTSEPKNFSSAIFSSEELKELEDSYASGTLRNLRCVVKTGLKNYSIHTAPRGTILISKENIPFSGSIAVTNERFNDIFSYKILDLAKNLERSSYASTLFNMEVVLLPANMLNKNDVMVFNGISCTNAFSKSQLCQYDSIVQQSALGESTSGAIKASQKHIVDFLTKHDRLFEETTSSSYGYISPYFTMQSTPENNLLVTCSLYYKESSSGKEINLLTFSFVVDSNKKESQKFVTNLLTGVGFEEYHLVETEYKSISSLVSVKSVKYSKKGKLEEERISELEELKTKVTLPSAKTTTLETEEDVEEELDDIFDESDEDYEEEAEDEESVTGGSIATVLSKHLEKGRRSKESKYEPYIPKHPTETAEERFERLSKVAPDVGAW